MPLANRCRDCQMALPAGGWNRCSSCQQTKDFKAKAKEDRKRLADARRERAKRKPVKLPSKAPKNYAGTIPKSRPCRGCGRPVSRRGKRQPTCLDCTDF